MMLDGISIVLPELQAQAESTMVVACRVRRPAGTDTDPDTGATVTIYGPDVFSGSGAPGDPGCKIQASQVQTLVAESADSSVSVERLLVHLPASSGPYRVGDVVFAAGLQLRIIGLSPKTFQTAQRLPVEELT